MRLADWPFPNLLASAMYDGHPAFVALFSRVEEQLSFIAACSVRSRSGLSRMVSTEDLLQETLLYAWRDRSTFRGDNEAQFCGWMKGILANRIREALRKSDRMGEGQPGADSTPWEARVPSNHTTPSQRAIRREQEDELGRAIKTLLPVEAEALRLHDTEKQSVQEVAERIGRTPSATGGILKRARKKLRHLLRLTNADAD